MVKKKKKAATLNIIIPFLKRKMTKIIMDRHLDIARRILSAELLKIVKLETNCPKIGDWFSWGCSQRIENYKSCCIRVF